MRHCFLFSSIICFLLTTVSIATDTGASEIWSEIDTQYKDYGAKEMQRPKIQPDKFRLFSLNEEKLEDVLRGAPTEQLDPSEAARTVSAYIDLPKPDGSYARFKFVQSPVMEPALAKRYPEITTYSGRLAGSAEVWARFDWTPVGFHAQVIGPDNIWYVAPYFQGRSYVSYYKKDYPSQAEQITCSAEHTDIDVFSESGEQTVFSSGEKLRTFRLAVATTGEYGRFHGGTKQLALSAVVSTINMITGVFERELRIRLTLINNNDSIIFVDPDTDLFSETDVKSISNLKEKSQTVIDKVIGEANYDIGHTFGAENLGGQALIESVCQADRKATGASSINYPVGDPYYLDIVAHEIGHQFGATHTYSSKAGHCIFYSASTAYEPGSGSTIMSYAGRCNDEQSDDNIQKKVDPIFHSVSYDQIIDYITAGFGSTCGNWGRTDNSVPVVDAGKDYIIPADTPFVLTGSATDDDGDPLTYRWEERDLGYKQVALTAPDNSLSPLFRTYQSANSAQRYFPKLSTLLDDMADNNSVPEYECKIDGVTYNTCQKPTDNTEKLPCCKGRTMNFRLTAQDSLGGRSADDMRVLVDSGAPPFRVTYPNGHELFSPGSVITVTWDVATTASLPIDAKTVDIYLAINRMDKANPILAWGTPLKKNTDNDGSETVTLPESEIEKRARIIVKASNNIFFDISDHDFSIMRPKFLPAILPAIYSLLLDHD